MSSRSPSPPSMRPLSAAAEQLTDTRPSASVKAEPLSTGTPLDDGASDSDDDIDPWF